MLKIIKKTLTDYKMLDNCAEIIVALSGGADSVALLLALNELKTGKSLSACHINHKLRDADSDNDEFFVRSLCDSLNIPLSVFTFDIKSMRKKHKSIEETARDVRYSCFSEISGDDIKIATAHTASDNAETVLLNITRGSGLRGLCGIPPVRDNIIRPLINIQRNEILAFLSERRQEFVTDKTNFNDEFSRNRIRLNVMPELTKINTSFVSGISKMCGFLRSDDDFLSSLACEGLKNAQSGNNQYNSTVIAALPLPIKSRAIAFILKESGVTPSSLRISEISELLEKNNGKINLCKNKFAVLRGNIFCVKTIHQNYRKKT